MKGKFRLQFIRTCHNLLNKRKITEGNFTYLNEEKQHFARLYCGFFFILHESQSINENCHILAVQSSQNCCEMAALAKTEIELEITVDCSCHTTYMYITCVYRSASDTNH